MKTCALDGCKKKFKPKRKDQRFCTPDHRWRHHSKQAKKQTLPKKPCELCGDNFSPSRETQKFCHPSHAKQAANQTRNLHRGYSPEHDMTHPAPDGYLVKGVSTLYTPEGKSAQWVKTDIDRKRMMELANEALVAMGESIKREKPTPAPKRIQDDLLNLYLITDYHLGAYAWAEETGADWDAKIAEDLLVDWFTQAVSSSPDAKVGVLAQLGDFLHFDGMEAITPLGRNLLDADTRFEKIVRVAIRSLRRVISLLLQKHELLHIIMAEGNHDPASSVWMREWFAALYENEPRVTVDQSPDPYYAYEFGQTALFFHHGHIRKIKRVDEVFAAKFKPLFGRTKHAYAHVGHLHSQAQHESPLMLVEQHRTLAASDAYASRGGWISGRGATAVTYHWEHGEVSRVTIGPELACRR